MWHIDESDAESWSSGWSQSGSSGLSRSTFRSQGIAARGDLSRHFRPHPKHRADTRAQIARDAAARPLPAASSALRAANLSANPLLLVLQCRTSSNLRPDLVPLAFARSIPARTPSRIMAGSNSDRAVECAPDGETFFK